MANMSLFDKTIRYQDKITFLDLLSGVKEKHTNEDAENALLAGTAIDRAATESVMLQKWKAPWLFLWIIIGGAVLSFLFFLSAYLFNHTAFILMCIVIPPFVVPVALMVFFWEMNVPRNISFFQLMLCFVTGGLFSLVVTLVLSSVGIGGSRAYLAPLTEEPGKLIISLLILYWFSRKKDFKIYGMTGLTIGAAVGAGFAAFESAYYIFSCVLGNIVYYFTSDLINNTNEYLNVLSSVLENGGFKNLGDVFFSYFTHVIGTYFDIVITRVFCGFNSHVLFCAPYVCVAALLMKNKVFELNALRSKYFAGVFVFSCVMHGIWNLFSGIFGSIIIWCIIFPAELILEWGLVTKLIQRCFRQIADNVATVSSASVLATDLKLRCLSGIHSGKVFALKNNSILIGKGATCNLVYPMGTMGISDRQCKIVVQNGALYLADAGSVDGTYLNGTKLKPLKGQLLKKGDVFWLGSEREKFLIE